MDRTKRFLRHTGVCSEVHHKEQYIPQAELEGGVGVVGRSELTEMMGRLTE